MKKIALIALMLAAAVLLTACSGGGLEGNTWKQTYDLGSYTTYSFSKGSCTVHEVNTITGQQYTRTVPYRISGNVLTFEANGEQESYEWKISGKTLTLAVGGQSITMDRQ